MFGTVDTWLVYKMTGETTHVTDYTNASRTLLYNIHTLAWDEDICKILDIPLGMLPEVKSSSEIFTVIPLRIISLVKKCLSRALPATNKPHFLVKLVLKKGWSKTHMAQVALCS